MAMTNKQWQEHRHYKFDPFAGEIQPALLNSSDIKRYVDKGCLIEKNDFDEERRLKTASYEMRFLGELHDWSTTKDGTLEPRRRNVFCGNAVKLPRNSITYLWMKEKLLLPEYIAARFNLHIRHVHKGILLGTGPLVDPGFFGNLLIPLHNLTNNDYELDGGEGIIWVEFTKLSEHEFWKRQGGKNPLDLKSFPHGKYIKDARGYLKKSGIIAKGGVQSAFKGALDRAEKGADGAREEAVLVRNIGLIAIVASIILIWLAGHNLISRATDIAQNSQNQMFFTNIEKRDAEIKKLEEDIETLEIQLTGMSELLNELKRQHD